MTYREYFNDDPERKPHRLKCYELTCLDILQSQTYGDLLNSSDIDGKIWDYLYTWDEDNQ